MLASVWKFFIEHKDIIIFISYDAKNFRIAQKFPDSNATLLPGFFSLWRRVGEILNRRPLTIRAATEENYYTIKTADLLLGRASSAPEDKEEPDWLHPDEEVARILPAQEQLAREWWLEWTRTCFADLVPRVKWSRNSKT